MRDSVELMEIKAECAPNRIHVQDLGGKNRLRLMVNASAVPYVWSFAILGCSEPGLTIDRERAALIIAEYENEA